MAALINVPAKAKRGDIIEIRTLTSHIMETGFRRTMDGALVPRDIITSFTCRFEGEEIFRADLFPATAANPFFSFFTVATKSAGTLWNCKRRSRKSSVKARTETCWPEMTRAW